MQIENNFEDDKKSNQSQLLNENQSDYSLKSGQEIPDKFNLKFKMISLLCIFVLINMIIAHSPFMQKYLNEFQKYLEYYYYTNRPFAIFNVSLFFALIMVFSIPVQMLYMIIITSVIKDSSVLFIVLYFTGLLTNFSVYFFMQIPTIRKKWKSFICDNIYFKVIKLKVDENVWVAAILARLLFIPAGIKLYIMCLLEIPPLCFVLTTLVGEAFDVTEYILIGSGVNGLRDFFDKKIWGLKTPVEKVHYYIMFGMMFFTVSFLIYVTTLFKVTKPSGKQFLDIKSIEYSTQKNSKSQDLTVDLKTLIKQFQSVMQKEKQKFEFKDLQGKDIEILFTQDMIILSEIQNQEQNRIQLLKQNTLGVQIDDYKSSFYIIFNKLKKNTKFKEKIIEQYKFKYDNIQKAIEFKNILLNWLYKDQPFEIIKNEQDDQYYYKKILFFINKNSGKKQADKIYQQIEQIILANGILPVLIYTQKDPFVQNYIQKLHKDELLSYDCIVGISGDGTIYEIIDGFYRRNDIDFDKEQITVFQLPAGSGCGLCENILKLSNGDKCTLPNALYYLCHMKKQELPVGKFEGLKKDNSVEIKYHFLNCNYGFLADVDKGSESFRFMGAARFEFYGHLKLLFINTYKLKIYLSQDTPLPDITQQELDQDNIELYDGNYFNVLTSILPYLYKDYLSSPQLINNLGKINVQLFPKDKGRIQFIKYLMKLGQFDPQDSRGAINLNGFQKKKHNDRWRRFG